MNDPKQRKPEHFDVSRVGGGDDQRTRRLRKAELQLRLAALIVRVRDTRAALAEIERGALDGEL